MEITINLHGTIIVYVEPAWNGQINNKYMLVIIDSLSEMHIKPV